MRDRRYFSGIGERLGFLPRTYTRTVPGAIWLHAVSVGEVLAAATLAERLRASQPAIPIYVSVTTLAGRELAGRRLQGLAAGVFFAPLDYVSCVRRVLRTLRPGLLIVLETEIWPNLFRESRRFGAGVLTANGRISERRANRYRLFRWFFARVLENACALLVQSEADRQRFLAAGAPPEKVSVAGNLKFDFLPGNTVPETIRQWIEAANPSRIWIAASTMPPLESGDVDEDDAVIAAFLDLARNRSDFLLILAPRRPERFDEAARKLNAAGIRFVRRSALAGVPPIPLPGVLLLDTIGELASVFTLADAVFMGGTLARRGGHNILEPAFFGKPVICGPNMQNFAEIAAGFRAAKAMVEIAAADPLADAVRGVFDGAHAQTGERGRELAARNRGAASRIAAAALSLHNQSLWMPRTPWPQWLFLAPLSALWAAAARWNRRRRQANVQRLPARVVSVGNVTFGGTGKTPLVRLLAELLQGSGARPAILTRGYRRVSPARLAVVPAGQSASYELTGDEAQLYLRDGHAHLAVCGDRAAAGRALLDSHPADVVLLDDGLQHAQLHRDLDIVTIDAFDPLGGGSCFPLGRLREPGEALEDAGAFVITRAEPGVPTGGIEKELRRIAPGARIFRARVVPGVWRPLGGAPPFAAKRVGAFCGLANPAAFFDTVSRLGLDIAFRWRFEDHHRYRPAEMARLARRAQAAGAEALVTTEKDSVNLPRGGGADGDGDAAAGLGLPVYWLPIRMEIAGAGVLLDLVRGEPRK